MTTIKRSNYLKHIGACGYSRSLALNVIRQSGGWHSFLEMAPDIARHGIDGGFHGWIYYCDTVAFAKRNKAAILDLAIDTADQVGSGLFPFLASFRCLDGMTENEIAAAIYSRTSEDSTQAFNALAWFAVEEHARLLSDLIDEV